MSYMDISIELRESERETKTNLYCNLYTKLVHVHFIIVFYNCQKLLYCI